MSNHSNSNKKIRSSDPGSEENKHSIESTDSRKLLARSDSMGLGQYKIVIGGPPKVNQRLKHQKTIQEQNSAIYIDQITQNSEFIQGKSVYIQSNGTSQAQSYKSKTKRIVIQPHNNKAKIQAQVQKSMNCSQLLDESSVIDSYNFAKQIDQSHFQEAELQVQVPIRTVAKTNNSNNSETQNFMRLLGQALTQNVKKPRRPSQVQYLDPRNSIKKGEKINANRLKQKNTEVKEDLNNKNVQQKQKYSQKRELNNTPIFVNSPFNSYKNNLPQPILPILRTQDHTAQQKHSQSKSKSIQPLPIYYQQQQPQYEYQRPYPQQQMNYQMNIDNSNLFNQLNLKQQIIKNLINQNNVLKNKEKQLKCLIFDMQQSYKLKQSSYQDQIYQLNRRNQMIQNQLIQRIQKGLVKERQDRLIQLLKKQKAISNQLHQYQNDFCFENSLKSCSRLQENNHNHNNNHNNNIPTQRFFTNKGNFNTTNDEELFDKKTVQNLNKKNHKEPDMQILQSSIIRRVKSQQKPFNIEYRHLKQVPHKRSNQKLKKVLHYTNEK